MPIDKIIDAIGRVIEIAERCWRGTLVLMAWSVLGTSLYLIAEHLSTLTPTPAQEQALLTRTVSANGKIDALLDQTLGAINADRIIVSQFHNGSGDISGLKFMRSSIMYASTAPGVALDASQIAPVPLSFFTPILARMRFDPDNIACVHVTPDDPSLTSSARARYKARGVDELYTCPMLSDTGSHIGTVTADYGRRDVPQRMTEEEVYARLRDTAALVQSHLRAVVTGPDPDPLWRRIIAWFGL